MQHAARGKAFYTGQEAHSHIYKGTHGVSVWSGSNSLEVFSQALLFCSAKTVDSVPRF